MEGQANEYTAAINERQGIIAEKNALKKNLEEER